MEFMRELKDVIGNRSDKSGQQMGKKFKKQIKVVLACQDWRENLEPEVQSFLKDEKQKKAYQKTFIDLILCIRNTFEHITELPTDQLRYYFGSSRRDVETYTKYWFNKFPKLLIWLYNNRPFDTDHQDNRPLSRPPRQRNPSTQSNNSSGFSRSSSNDEMQQRGKYYTSTESLLIFSTSSKKIESIRNNCFYHKVAQVSK